jgi:hypothetical protein
MAHWDGVTKSSTLKPEHATLRLRLAEVARTYQWVAILEILREHPDLANVTRPDGKSLYMPLHQAAHGSAPVEVIEELVRLGAWRCTRNASGERAVDIARKQGHTHLVPILEPVFLRQVDPYDLNLIQEYFHAVIRGRARALVDEHQLQLPQLEALLEMEQVKVWFAVPGMYGGFSFWLEEDGSQPRLVSESWSRVVGGSGQRHVVTKQGLQLVEEGFV